MIILVIRVSYDSSYYIDLIFMNSKYLKMFNLTSQIFTVPILLIYQNNIENK